MLATIPAILLLLIAPPNNSDELFPNFPIPLDCVAMIFLLLPGALFIQNIFAVHGCGSEYWIYLGTLIPHVYVVLVIEAFVSLAQCRFRTILLRTSTFVIRPVSTGVFIFSIPLYSHIIIAKYFQYLLPGFLDTTEISCRVLWPYFRVGPDCCDKRPQVCRKFPILGDVVKSFRGFFRAFCCYTYSPIFVGSHIIRRDRCARIHTHPYPGGPSPQFCQLDGYPAIRNDFSGTANNVNDRHEKFTTVVSVRTQ